MIYLLVDCMEISKCYTEFWKRMHGQINLNMNEKDSE